MSAPITLHDGAVMQLTRTEAARRRAMIEAFVTAGHAALLEEEAHRE